MAELVIIEGEQNGERIALDSSEAFNIGREPENSLQIDDGSVSSLHSDIRLVNGSWIVSDLDSSNGTLVNDQEVTKAHLNDGDIITIGASSFMFRANPQAATPPPPEAIAPPPAVPAPSIMPTPPRQAPEPSTSAEDVELVQRMREKTDLIRAEVGKVIVGQTEVLDQVLMCILANGHALLIGLPGMAKTLMVRTLATVLNLDFKRVQFTPDLMPTDIIGTDVLETDQTTGEKEFRFIRGPLFCNLLLADEINRTPPKTQAALLEAMQEKCVTAGNKTYELDEPFFVLATQNPVEQEGTYPLPEAQLDRFMFNIWVDYPSADEEEQIVSATTAGRMTEPNGVLTQEEILQLQAVVRKVPVSQHVVKYVIRLVRATRPQNDDSPECTKTYISTGAGPRAGQSLVLAAKAMAILDGRIHVSCADIRRAAPPVLRHRILTNFAADSEGLSSLSLVERLLKEVPEPDASAYS